MNDRSAKADMRNIMAGSLPPVAHDLIARLGDEARMRSHDAAADTDAAQTRQGQDDRQSSG